MTKALLPRVTTRNRELRDEVVETLVIVVVKAGVKFLHRALKPERCKSCRSSVARAHDEHHAQGVLVLSQEVTQVRPDEYQARAGSPVAKQARFNMLQLQGILKEDIVLEENHR